MSKVVVIFLTGDPTKRKDIPYESLKSVWTAINFCHTKNMYVDLLISTMCQVPGQFRYSTHLNNALMGAYFSKDVEYIIQLSDDVILPHRTTIYNMVRSMENYGKPAIFGCRQYVDKSLTTEVCPGYHVHPRTLQTQPSESKTTLDELDPDAEYYTGFDYITFAIIGWHREAIEKVGIMDPRFEFYSEDVDYCLRAKYLNDVDVVLLNKSKVTHIGELTFRHHPHRGGAQERGWKMLREKWAPYLKEHGGLPR